MNWRPIDTAPKDGREIRLRRKGETTTYTGRWFEQYGRTAPWTWHMKPAEWEWMPLPQAPGAVSDEVFSR